MMNKYPEGMYCAPKSLTQASQADRITLEKMAASAEKGGAGHAQSQIGVGP
jgi:hypothetical protein